MRFRCYFVCIGFIHFLLLVMSAYLIIMCSKIIYNRDSDYTYRLLYGEDIVIVLLCAGVFGFLLVLMSVISVLYTCVPQEPKVLYRLVAFVAIIAMALDLAFLIMALCCQKSDDRATDEFYDIFNMYGQPYLYYEQPNDSHEQRNEPPCKAKLRARNETRFIHDIQNKYECCGVKGYQDYETINQSVPLSCCGVEKALLAMYVPSCRFGICPCINFTSANGTTTPDAPKTDATQPPRLREILKEDGRRDRRPAAEGGAMNASEDLGVVSKDNNIEMGSLYSAASTPRTQAHKHLPDYVIEEALNSTHRTDCDGCQKKMNDGHHSWNTFLWIFVFLKMILELYAATSSCFILLAEAPPGKYPY